MTPLVPVYHQIRNKIQEWIASKEYDLGEQIPSETELAKMFAVTRMTVRQALGLLIQDGLLKRRRGSGTFVTTDAALVGRLGLDCTGFMDELFYQTSKSKTVSVKIEKVPTPRSVKEKLKTEAPEVYRVERVRTLNDRIFAFTVNYLPEQVGKRIEEKALYEKPMLKILEGDLNIEFDEALQTIEATFSDQYVSDRMEIQSGSSILLVERIMYDAGKTPFELVQTYYRGDSYKYVVRLKIDRDNKAQRWIYLR